MKDEDVVIDPDTGLPLLPEGYFWRIEDGEYGDVWLSIRKRRKRFGSKSIIQNCIHANLDDWKAGKIDAPERIHYVSDELFTPEAILGTAKHLLGRWHERDAKQMRYEKNKSLLGDYPPNTLEGK